MELRRYFGPAEYTFTKRNKTVLNCKRLNEKRTEHLSHLQILYDTKNILFAIPVGRYVSPSAPHSFLSFQNYSQISFHEKFNIYFIQLKSFTLFMHGHYLLKATYISLRSDSHEFHCDFSCFGRCLALPSFCSQ